MNKWIKAIGGLVGILLIAVLVVFCITTPTKAKEAQLTLDAPEEVKVGETFILSVKLDSDSALAGLDARIIYDPAMVSFVSDEEGKMTGAEGLVNLKDTYEEETNQKVYQLTFQALSVGDAAFAFDKTYITDYANLEEMEIYSNHDTVSIVENDKISENADLSELLVATGQLSPAFSADVTEYTVSVDEEEDTFIFSSTPADEEAVVEVDMPDTLAMGENQVVITVTAPSGAVKEYVIHVYRGR